MPADIGACGSLGIAFEDPPGVYQAPTKFFPIQNESMQYIQDLRQRRGIRQVANMIGTIPGNARIEGTISMEFFDDVVPYFLTAARSVRVDTGSDPNYIYTFSPAHCAGLGSTGKTLSITTVRNGTVNGWIGCQVGSFTITIEDGVLMFNVNVMGLDESTPTDPTEVWETTQIPYGPGTYDIEIPTASDVADLDAFTFTVEDGLTPEHRLRAARGPAFLRYGERLSTLQVNRDFLNKTDFNAFKAGTSQSVTLKATRGANNNVEILMPVAYKETYEYGLSGQGDLIRGSINYFASHDATVGGDYKITVKTQEDLTP